MSAPLMPGAEPFAFDGGSTGVLLVHGFTGSPQGMREWGEYLAERRYAVLGPRLPGHGTAPADLHTVTAQDWIDEADRALQGLLQRCSQVFIGALSMGCAVTLHLAAKHGDAIAGLMLVNPFLYSNDPRVKLAPILGRLPLLLKGVHNDVADPSRAELGYAKVSSKGAWHALEIGKQAKTLLPSITQPALIFCSRQDHIVHPGNASLVYETIASKDKDLLWLERSYHVATLDFDRQIIFERSAKFIEQHEEP